MAHNDSFQSMPPSDQVACHATYMGTHALNQLDTFQPSRSTCTAAGSAPAFLRLSNRLQVFDIHTLITRRVAARTVSAREKRELATKTRGAFAELRLIRTETQHRAPPSSCLKELPSLAVKKPRCQRLLPAGI